MSILATLFWLCIGGVFYIYAGYPLLIGFLARWFPRPVRKSPNTLTATVIIVGYNEAPRLAGKIENILSVHGADRIQQILIGSDGSTDQPEAALAGIQDPRVKLVTFPERRGKPSVLNDLIPQATADILVLMDVRQRLHPKALQALLDNFSDPTVGVVSGELVFEQSESDTSAAQGIDAYWRYEKWIRERESRFDSVPGATGALYAIRRELAKPIPAESALDDVLIPMQAIAQSFRCLLEPNALIFDQPSQDAAQEAIRKRRTLAGCVQLLRLHPAWCIPGGHPIWWQFSSHKIARLFSPVLLLGALAFSILLTLNHFIYGLLLAGQFLGYGLGLWGIFILSSQPQGRGRFKWYLVPRICGLFCVMQITLLTAWTDGLKGTNLALWRKTST